MNKRYKVFRLDKIEFPSASPYPYRNTFALEEVYFDGDGLPTQEEAEKQLEMNGYVGIDYVILPVFLKLPE